MIMFLNILIIGNIAMFIYFASSISKYKSIKQKTETLGYFRCTRDVMEEINNSIDKLSKGKKKVKTVDVVNNIVELLETKSSELIRKVK